jgi:hypothetical protein
MLLRLKTVRRENVGDKITELLDEEWGNIYKVEERNG